MSTQDEQSPVSREPVEIEINGQLLSVRRSIPELRLPTRVLKPIASPRGQRRRVSLLTPKIPRPNAGLWPAAALMCSQAGYAVHVNMPQVARLPLTVLTNLPQGSDVAGELLEFVGQQPRGLIRYGTGVDRAWLIAQIALSRPKATIAVATATNPEASSLHRRLTALGVQNTLVTRRECPAEPRRVVVGTYTAMAHPQIECHRRHLFIAANAAHALGQHAQACLTLQPDIEFRLFGLLRTDQLLSPAEEDWLRATFGFDEIAVPAHGAREARPRVLWLPYRRPRDADDYDAARLKKQLIWNEPPRNRRICTLAKLLANGDHDAVCRRFPQIAQLPGPWPPRQVIVLVESVDHAARLLERLPGWPLAAVWPPRLDGLSPQERMRIERAQSMWCLGTQAVITASAASQYCLSHSGGLSLIIWAGSGPGLPPLPPSWLIHQADCDHSIGVIDFRDHHHAQLARRWRRRAKAYRESEWLRPGLDPLLARVERFLAMRPRSST